VKSGSVAKRYAAALLQVAKSENKVSDYLSELERVVAMERDSRELQSFLASPVVKSGAKKAFFKAVAEKLQLSPMMLNFIYVLLDHDHGDDLGLVYFLYRDMADEILGQIRVAVTSAAPLGAQEEKLKSLLAARFKQKILIVTKVDPEVLGGLTIQVKDLVFDGSLRRELERVKAAIVLKAVA